MKNGVYADESSGAAAVARLEVFVPSLRVADTDSVESFLFNHACRTMRETVVSAVVDPSALAAAGIILGNTNNDSESCQLVAWDSVAARACSNSKDSCWVQAVKATTAMIAATRISTLLATRNAREVGSESWSYHVISFEEKRHAQVVCKGNTTLKESHGVRELANVCCRIKGNNVGWENAGMCANERNIPGHVIAVGLGRPSGNYFLGRVESFLDISAQNDQGRAYAKFQRLERAKPAVGLPVGQSYPLRFRVNYVKRVVVSQPAGKFLSHV